MAEVLIRNFTKKIIDHDYFDKILKRMLKIVGEKKTVELSLVITGNKKIRNINKKYRKIDEVTDVLSFGNEDFDGFVNPPDKISYLGEIFICYPRAELQASQKGYSVKKEMGILFVHGILHVLGYDHENKEERIKMNIKEKEMARYL